MADITRLPAFIGGVVRGIDLTTNDLKVGSLKIGLKQLTEVVLGNLIDHIASTANPHSVTKSQILTGNLIVDADVDASAAIAQSKLNLAITNSEVAAAAGIVYSKLSIADADLTIAKTNGLQSALNNKLETSLKGAVNGLAELDASGKLASGQIPAIAITSTYVVADETAQLALTVQEGDVAVRSDENKSYIALNADNEDMGDWQLLLTPTDAVQSVNGYTGVVVLDSDDISEGSNKYFTEARVLSSVITGFVSGAGTLADTDTVLEAIQKLDGNIAAITDTDDQTASEVPYTAADSSDWVLEPSEVASGLDELASRVSDTESSLKYTKALTDTFQLGEAMTVAGLTVLRAAIPSGTSEVANKFYKADPTADSLGTNLKQPYEVVGLFNAVGNEPSDTYVNVVKYGRLNTTSAHGFAIGEALFLDSNGAVTQTAPTTTNEAVVFLGIPVDANTIEVQPKLRFVN